MFRNPILNIAYVYKWGLLLLYLMCIVATNVYEPIARTHFQFTQSNTKSRGGVHLNDHKLAYIHRYLVDLHRLSFYSMYTNFVSIRMCLVIKNSKQPLTHPTNIHSNSISNINLMQKHNLFTLNNNILTHSVSQMMIIHSFIHSVEHKIYSSLEC